MLKLSIVAKWNYNIYNLYSNKNEKERCTIRNIKIWIVTTSEYFKLNCHEHLHHIAPCRAFKTKSQIKKPTAEKEST